MKKTFIHYNEAWYRIDRDDFKDEICVQLRWEQKILELFITFHELGDKNWSAKIQLEDAWRFLSFCPDLIRKLSELSETNPAPEIIITTLKELGFEDITPRKRHENKMETTSRA
jgi:hypothetical protein